jgi:hypothetical protein
MSNSAVWIQAIASVVTLLLAGWSLIILRKYAADTATIAKSSVSQLEASQTPFLAVVMVRDERGEGWEIENQGFGPALNGTMSWVQNGKQVLPLSCVGAGCRTNIHSVFAGLVGNQGGLEIHYESLSGRKYSTRLTWGELGEMKLGFER